MTSSFPLASFLLFIYTVHCTLHRMQHFVISYVYYYHDILFFNLNDDNNNDTYFWRLHSNTISYKWVFINNILRIVAGNTS